MQPTEQPSPETIEEFVISSHFNLPKVQEMLEQEPVLLNQKWTKFDEDALQASGHMGRRDIAEYLLAKGAPLTIFAAAMLGRLEDVERFLADDPGLASANGVHGISILYHTALSGNVQIADILVAHGGGEGTGAALHGAVRPGQIGMVRWLLARGADPNVLDYEGKMPLTVALENGRKEIAEILRQHGGTE